MTTHWRKTGLFLAPILLDCIDPLVSDEEYERLVSLAQEQEDRRDLALLEFIIANQQKEP